jgi:hypothetical protein
MDQLFLVWRKAKRLRVKLPATKDPAYANLDLLLRHGLRASRGYLTWLCEVLGRPDPKVPDPPEALDVGKKGAAYLRTLERAWHTKMAWMPSRVLDSPDLYTSRWGTPMTVEAMLEHALAHPMRHRFQLEELIAKKRKRR